jgi:hypothetical protein
MLLVLGGFLSVADAQTSEQLFEIQKAYYAGELTVDRAIDMQRNLIENSETPLKCGTPLEMFYHQHKDELGASSKVSHSPLLKSAAVDYISPSGKFRISYQTSGNDAVPLDDSNGNTIPDYVEWIGEAADSSYRHEILTLGFTDPIPLGTTYRVVVRDLGAYGITRTSATEPSGTLIEIENDFVGFPSNTDPEGDQKGAVKVTMAHELKHAIQYVQNNWNGSSDLWAEMDATLYEEIVYDDVNDYYNYLDGFADNWFSDPGSTLFPGSYEDITWALYFEEEYGPLFWTKVWDRIEANPSIDYFDAIDQQLAADASIPLEQAMVEAATWHFASGPKLASPFYGFQESLLYPSPFLSEEYDSLLTAFTPNSNLVRLSANYHMFDLTNPSTQLVQFDFTTTLSNIHFGLIAYNFDQSIDTRYFTPTETDTIQSFKTTLNWDNIERLGVIAVNTSQQTTGQYSFRLFDYFPTEAEGIQLAQNYPNPFNPETTIEVTLPFSQYVKVSIYDIRGRLVQVLQDGVLRAGVNSLRFDGSDLASGLYFYRAESNDKVELKKMMLIK